MSLGATASKPSATNAKPVESIVVGRKLALGLACQSLPTQFVKLGVETMTLAEAQNGLTELPMNAE